MNVKDFGIISLVILLFVSLACKTSENVSGASESEWEVLFNGENLEGWRTIENEDIPDNGWFVEGNELIVRESTDGSIITKEKYSDFELRWEWKMLNKGGNSGVKYFVNSKGGENAGLGLEYQILDDENHSWMLEGKMKPNDYHTAGACYELYEPVGKKVSALGKWNKCKIISKNGEIEHWLNGKKIVEFNRFSEDFDERVAKSKFNKAVNFAKQDSGHILLQDHGGIVHFRNIKIREL